MPIRIPDSLPAHAILEAENIFVMTEHRAMHQDIRPLNVLILNLMPTKIITETQLLRKLSNTPLQICVDFLQTASYTSTHTDPEHLKQFYYTFDQIKDRRYDGMIITGAPLDYVPYEETAYWDEVCKIMEWTKTHVHCTFHLCWGAYAGLYYHYGIKKFDLDKKLFGIFPHQILKKTSPLFRGFNDEFLAPHSRATDVNVSDVAAVPELEIMALTKEGSQPLLRQKTADSSLSPVMPNMMPILLHLSIIVIWKKVLQALIFQSTIFQMMIRQRHQLSPGALQDSSYILIG